MSDLSENQIIQQEEGEVVPEIDNTNYFKEQDEKFEELHKKLQKLKEENKKQIDAIINSLDDLMASKCVIEQTLDKVAIDDIPIDISNEKLNVVELLSKVTGIVSDSNICSSKVDQKKECESEDASVSQEIKEENKSESSGKTDCTDDQKKECESKDDSVSQVSKEEFKIETSDKMECIDDTTKNSDIPQNTSGSSIDKSEG